jgi:phosphoribosylglycinamide formyltransferase-1
MAALPARPRIGFLASHSGTNMRAIVKSAREGFLAAIPAVAISNNRDSAALVWARENLVPAVHLSSATTDDVDGAIAECLEEHLVDLVVLAGYMRKLGPKTIAAFKHRILNVHPALLPKFGGQGMYGNHVYEAVLKAGEKETGATIHLVDDEYDHGAVVAQARVPLEADDTVASLTARVQTCEQALFPDTLRRIIAREIDLDAL